MNEDPDQRIVDRTELGDRLVGTGEITVDDIRRTPQFLERGDQLAGGLARLGEGPLVRLGPIVSGPENGDFFRHEHSGQRSIESRHGKLEFILHDADSRQRDDRALRCWPSSLASSRFAGESIDVDHAAAVHALGDDFDAVVRLDLKCDGRCRRRGSPGRDSVTVKPFGGRSQVLDFDERPDAALVRIQERSDRVASRIFEVGNEPRRRQHRRHPRVGEADAILRAHEIESSPVRPVRGGCFIDAPGCETTVGQRFQPRAKRPGSANSPRTLTLLRRNNDNDS